MTYDLQLLSTHRQSLVRRCYPSDTALHQQYRHNQWHRWAAGYSCQIDCMVSVARTEWKKTETETELVQETEEASLVSVDHSHWMWVTSVVKTSCYSCHCNHHFDTVKTSSAETDTIESASAVDVHTTATFNSAYTLFTSCIITNGHHDTLELHYINITNNTYNLHTNCCVVTKLQRSPQKYYKNYNTPL